MMVCTVIKLDWLSGIIIFVYFVYLLVLLDGADNLEKSEVQAIIESTPELDMDLDGCIGTR